MDPSKPAGQKMTTNVIISGAAPSPPDIHVCNPFYGQDIDPQHCQNAARRIPVSTVYSVGGPFLSSMGSRIPFAINYESCWISVEIGGPVVANHVDLGALVLRSMASLLIQRCVVQAGGMGGFTTHGLNNMLEYILSPMAMIDQVMDYLPSTLFLTLTISRQRPEPPYQPGNKDPMIPLALSDYNLRIVLDPNIDAVSRRIYGSRLAWFTQQSVAMTRGGSRQWWEPRIIGADQMTYQCDVSLGTPSEVDCLHIQWDQLSPASDTVQVGPGSTTFLHSNTCYLAISAVMNLVLTWAQIRAGLDHLLNACVQNPIAASRGGRAYYESHSQPIPIHGRRRKRQTNPTGLNALPPGSNLTIFQQIEPWENATSELKSCTWMAIKKGIPVTQCHA